jgi:hypothetical protein
MNDRYAYLFHSKVNKLLEVCIKEIGTVKIVTASQSYSRRDLFANTIL